MSISSPRQKKYFSLIDKSHFPSLIGKNEVKDTIKVTLSLVKKNKFIYLDMNATNGFKAMEQTIDPESDDQDEKFGPFVVCQGSKTSRQKIKLKEFLTVNHKIRERRNLIRSRVKEELDKSRDKFASINDTIEKSKNQIRLFRGLSNQKYETIKDNLQTEEINAQILRKQQKMIQKLGIVSDFQSFKDKSTPSFVQKPKKVQNYFLPKILRPVNERQIKIKKFLS